ncbi:MAG: hypothetical protein AAGF12_33170 [Myxococcota bacterium]
MSTSSDDWIKEDRLGGFDRLNPNPPRPPEPDDSKTEDRLRDWKRLNPNPPRPPRKP